MTHGKDFTVTPLGPNGEPVEITFHKPGVWQISLYGRPPAPETEPVTHDFRSEPTSTPSADDGEPEYVEHFRVGRHNPQLIYRHWPGGPERGQMELVALNGVDTQRVTEALNAHLERLRMEESGEQEDIEHLIYQMWDSEPCRLDHDGDCQEHNWFGSEEECPHARARRYLEGTAEWASRPGDDEEPSPEVQAAVHQGIALSWLRDGTLDLAALAAAAGMDVQDNTLVVSATEAVNAEKLRHVGRAVHIQANRLQVSNGTELVLRNIIKHLRELASEECGVSYTLDQAEAAPGQVEVFTHTAMVPPHTWTTVTEARDDRPQVSVLHEAGEARRVTVVHDIDGHGQRNIAVSMYGDSGARVRGPVEAAQLLAELGRDIWGHEEPSLAEQATFLAVTLGDLQRQARSEVEGKPVDTHAVRRELANLVLTAARFAQRWGLDDAINSAVQAQRAYAKREGRAWRVKIDQPAQTAPAADVTEEDPVLHLLSYPPAEPGIKDPDVHAVDNHRCRCGKLELQPSTGCAWHSTRRQHGVRLTAATCTSGVGGKPVPCPVGDGDGFGATSEPVEDDPDEPARRLAHSIREQANRLESAYSPGRPPWAVRDVISDLRRAADVWAPRDERPWAAATSGEPMEAQSPQGTRGDAGVARLLRASPEAVLDVLRMAEELTSELRGRAPASHVAWVGGVNRRLRDLLGLGD